MAVHIPLTDRHLGALKSSGMKLHAHSGPRARTRLDAFFTTTRYGSACNKRTPSSGESAIEFAGSWPGPPTPFVRLSRRADRRGRGVYASK